MDTSGELEPTQGNPYIGPRPYSRKEEKLFFGRERESRDLLSLVVSERLVLFYAQSGAGKTSLINTRLAPGLEGRNFEVLPVGRVSGELLPGQQVENIFATNLMLKLDMGEDDPKRFTGLRLAEFLLRLTYDGKGFYYRPATDSAPVEMPADEDEIEVLPRALIIDQFEELFTTHAEAWKLRADFIQQLAEAMDADPYLWVVLAMREDHIAELDPHASLLPGGLRARYYMQRMGAEAAFDAVTKPVEKLRPFENQAAHMLVNNLSRISAGKDDEGKTRFVDGEFIEPVQLQVVCYQLWEDLTKQPGDQITLADLQRLARGQDLAEFINRALADFYEDTLKKAAHQPGLNVREGRLREWFSTQLITEAGTRGFVYMGEQLTAGIPNNVVLSMEGKLLRGESRAGGRWYELVHDRFIDPILQANRQWAQARQRRLVKVGGGSVLGVLLVSLCTFLSFSAYSATRVVGANRTGTAVAFSFQAVDQTSTAYAIEFETAVAQATLGSAQLAAVMEGKANLISQQAAAAKTIEAAAFEATLSHLDAQSTILAPTLGIATSIALPTETASSLTATATFWETQATPAPTFIAFTPTPTPIEIIATEAERWRLATATAIQRQRDELIATQTAQTQPVRRQVIGTTSNNTPISVTQIGTGPRNIVVVGGLTGSYAQRSRELAKKVQDYYNINRHQIPKDITLHVIIDANPDSINAPGNVVGRKNPNGVDLNRNWDCNWARETTFAGFPVDGGKEPFSELETQALRDYFNLTQPEAVILWDGTTRRIGAISPGGCGEVSLFSGWLNNLYAKQTGYTRDVVASNDTGDAANWLDAQGIPAIRVRLSDIDLSSLTQAELKIEETNHILAVRAIINQLSP